MLDVISIGGATIDIFVKSRQFIVDNNLISLTHSSKNEIDKSLICSGGGATNSAVSFARLGLKSTCISLVGQDNLRSYIIDDLKVGMVCVDEATTLKRISPRAKGRANRISKRTSHITIKVTDEE